MTLKLLIFLNSIIMNPFTQNRDLEFIFDSPFPFLLTTSAPLPCPVAKLSPADSKSPVALDSIHFFYACCHYFS